MFAGENAPGSRRLQAPRSRGHVEPHLFCRLWHVPASDETSCFFVEFFALEKSLKRGSGHAL